MNKKLYLEGSQIEVGISSLKSLTYQFEPKTRACARQKCYFFIFLDNFSRQAPLTHPENDLFSLLACSSTCSRSSSSKRIILEVLFKRSKLLFRFLSCIGLYRCDRLIMLGLYHNKSKYLKRQCPYSADNTSEASNHNIKDANAMADSYDTLHPENGQQRFSHLFSVLKQYRFNISPNNLSEIKGHFEELQSSIISGIGAMGSLMFWATESNDYEFDQLKNDIRDIGYLLIHLRTISEFTANEINRMNVQSHKEGGEQHA